MTSLQAALTGWAKENRVPMGDTFTIDCAVGISWSKSGKALLVRAEFFDEGTKFIPKSQILMQESEVTEPGDSGDLVVRGWLARQEGWQD